MKCPNQKTCTFTFMHFKVGALPMVQKSILKNVPDYVKTFVCIAHHCFRAPFLSLGALLSTGATLPSFYLLVELGLLLYLFPVFFWQTRPALCKKKPACMFEIYKKKYFQAPFRHVQRRFWASWQKQKLKLSDFPQKVCSAIQRLIFGGNQHRGKETFSNKIYTLLRRPRPDFRGGIPLRIFNIYCFFKRRPGRFCSQLKIGVRFIVSKIRNGFWIVLHCRVHRTVKYTALSSTPHC